jgi:hypothetical protein
MAQPQRLYRWDGSQRRQRRSGRAQHRQARPRVAGRGRPAPRSQTRVGTAALIGCCTARQAADAQAQGRPARGRPPRFPCLPGKIGAARPEIGAGGRAGLLYGAAGTGSSAYTGRGPQRLAGQALPAQASSGPPPKSNLLSAAGPWRPMGRPRARADEPPGVGSPAPAAARQARHGPRLGRVVVVGVASQHPRPRAAARAPPRLGGVADGGQVRAGAGAAGAAPRQAAAAGLARARGRVVAHIELPQARRVAAGGGAHSAERRRRLG